MARRVTVPPPDPDPGPWHLSEGPDPAETDRGYVRDASCQVPAELRAPSGFVYLLHFDPPIVPYEGAPGYKTAGHYTGHAEPGRLAARLHEEATGGANAAKIVQHQIRSGGRVILADLQPGGYDRERQLKNGHGSAARRCQVCQRDKQPGAARWRPGADADIEPEAGG